jgi:Lar family restriction alleviation protein|nr:MAG TPA: restriction alleviation protein [Caudoviricetes sp.]
MQDCKLKPCPFCGERKIELVEPDYFFGSWFCECTACRQAIAAGETQEKAMKKWNRRAPGWFSVDKVLPLNRTHVIGFDIESGWNYPLLYFYPDTKEFLDEAYDYKPVSITHWMPYPDAPEEEDDDE